jgi:hypothetical protein
MKKFIAGLCLVLGFMGFSSVATADDHSRVVVLWQCELKEGKSIDDVHAANGKWVKHVNANVEGGDIHSYVLATVVGKSGTFLYADSFPTMASWEAAMKIESDEMAAIEEGLDAVADCRKNSLHMSKES